MSEYKVSIISPFHNTGLDMFKKSYEGMKKQTIGFDNIQWIIVLHNCKQELIEGAKKIVGQHSNVEIYELYNDLGTASSPRNYGIQFVKAPYMGFLDSDDWFTVECLARSYEAITRNEADVVSFRLEFEKQNSKLKGLVTEQGIFNPLLEEVVIDHNHRGDPRLVSSFILSSQTKIYRTAFINENNIRFVEEMIMNETARFVTDVYALANKIVVLPQFIGYHYYINSGSLIQTPKRPREKILNFAEHYAMMFERVYKNGLYYNHVFIIYLRLLIHYSLNCYNLTEEDFEYIKKIMKPYVDLLFVPPVNKLFTKQEGEYIYNHIKEVFNSSFAEFKNTNNKVVGNEERLIYIIENNENTDFGQYYGFENIKSIQDYQKVVPLYTKDSYKKLLDIQTNVGERNVLSSKEPQIYVYNFDDEKYGVLPLSTLDAKGMQEDNLNIFKDNVSFLMIESLPDIKTSSDNVFTDSLNGALLTNTIGKYNMVDFDESIQLTSPLSLLFPKVSNDIDYLNLLYALRNRNVTQIVASNSWRVDEYIQKFIKYFDDLISDIEKGKVMVSNSLSKSLNDLYVPNVSRALELKDIDKNDFRLTDIWPNLTKIVTRSGGTYQIYTDRISKYLDQNVSLVNPGLMLPCGYLGKKTTVNDLYLLNKNDYFLEFRIPFDKTNRIYTSGELEPNQTYEVVMTNNSGVYRLCTNCFVYISHIISNQVFFKEVCDLIQTSEKVLNCNDIYNIIKGVLRDNIFDYNYTYENDKLSIFVETSSASLTKADKENIAKAFNNLDVVVYEIEKESQLLRRDTLRLRYHCPADCIEPVRLKKMK